MALDKYSLTLSTNLGFLTLTGGFCICWHPLRMFLGKSGMGAVPKLSVVAKEMLLKS